jgi:hypothetical protein
MTSLRLWIGLLALVSFTAGVASGMMLSARNTPPPRWGELADYETMLVDHFQLSPERARCLRALLQEYERDFVRVVRSQRENEYIASHGAELGAKSQEYERLIKEKVLPPSRREEFARLCAPIPFPPAH